jgi:hypothetical protein
MPAHMTTRMTPAKIAIAAAALALLPLSTAFTSSHYETMYRDTIRPHGQPRSQKIYDAALDYCYGETHESRTEPDTQAFKDCMAGRAYQYRRTKEVQDPPRRTSRTRSQDGTYISTDTGEVCHSVCTPPNGTGNYTNDEGLNCTRTGLVSFCSNF